MSKTISTFMLLLLVMAGCSEPKGSMKYYDSHMYNRFIEKLDENGVKYREGNDLNVFYPASQSQLVKAIASEVTAEYSPGCGGSFTSKEKQLLMEAALKDKGIPYTVVNTDKGLQITCSPENRDAFHELFMQVLRGEYSE